MVVAVILVLTVLLQAGKGAGMGAAFGGSSGTVFGARGPATLISKITCGAAVIFMCTSLNLALSQRNGGVSVMEEYSAPADAPLATPAEPSTPVVAPAEEGDQAAAPADAAAAPAEASAPEASQAEAPATTAPAEKTE